MSKSVTSSRYTQAHQILRFSTIRTALADAAVEGKSYITSYRTPDRRSSGRQTAEGHWRRPLVVRFGRDRSMRRLATRAAVADAVCLMAARIERRAARQAREAALATMGMETLTQRLAAIRAKRAERLRQRIAAAVTPHYNRCHYRQATAGDHTLSVQVGEPLARGHSDQGDTYSGRCTWRKTDSYHRLIVPARWRQRVERRGLAIVGGRLVLDAVKVRGRNGVYDAVWAEQDRGFALRTGRGRILVAEEFGPAGEDDAVQIAGLMHVVAVSDLGTIVRDDSGSIVQVVVLDPSTGFRHHLTVPPKFGRELLTESEADRVRAAIAWTFGIPADQYRPEIAA